MHRKPKTQQQFSPASTTTANARSAEQELDDIYDGLDKLIQAISGIKVLAEYPDGVIQLTVGCDGRLIKLWIDPGATNRFTHLVLEQKFNQTMRDALDEVARARSEMNASAVNYLPPN